MNQQLQAYIDKINANDLTVDMIILEDLNLYDDDISQLMAALAKNLPIMQQIIMLNLDCNNLTACPDLTRFAAINCLSINNNQLTSPPILAGLTALVTLDLSNNQLTSPPIVTGLTALEAIGLNDNKLTTYPDLTGLIALQWLSIMRNNLTEASKIGLGTERVMRGANVEINYDNFLPINSELNYYILNQHFRTIISKSYPLTFINDDLDIQTLLKDLKTSMNKNHIFIVDKEEFKQLFIAITVRLQSMFPGNELVMQYINDPKVILGFWQDANNVLEKKLAVIICGVENHNTEYMKEIIYHSSHNADFTFVLAQTILHEVYLKASSDFKFNNQAVNWLVDLVLFLQQTNIKLALKKEMNYLMYGHPKFMNTITPLMKIAQLKKVVINPVITEHAVEFTADIDSHVAQVKRLRQ